MRYNKCFLFLSCFVFALVIQLSCSNRQEAKVIKRIPTDPKFVNSIYGTVTDDRGQPLPGVSIVLMSSNGGSESSFTGPSGAFLFRGLPVDSYSVEFIIEGFTEVRQENVVIREGSAMQLAIMLRPSLSEEFTVIGETPMIDTRSNTIKETYRPREGFESSRKKRNSTRSEVVPPPSAPPAETVAGSAYGSPASPEDVPSELVVIARDDEWLAPPTQQDKREPGRLEARNVRGQVLSSEFPLQRVVVDAQADGFLAHTTLKQEYANPYSEVIEAVYVFPLPSLAAVNGFEMEAHGRRIIGIVRKREEAEEIYRQALEQGMTASLLTQERPNVFTQSIANVEPGGSVSITISYVERLAYENGSYEYVFPMVVGERYTGGDDACECPTATGKVTEYLPEPKAANLPVAIAGYDGHTVDFTLRLDAGLPVHSLSSATHQIEVTEEGPTIRTVRLKPQSVANHDFILRWSVASVDTQFGLLAHRSQEDGFFTLMMQPPLEPADASVTPREITFIMDISGSMEGLPIEISKELVTRSIDKLRSFDIFNIVYFAGSNGQLWDAPKAPTSENLGQAWEYLKRMEGGGGTEMMAGLHRALSAKHESQYLQMFVFLTDGFVSEDSSILAAIRANKGGARFFAFGIGDTVNRYLIDGIGELGGGYAQTVIPQDISHGQRAVDQFFAAIDSPVLVDVSIDWNGMPVSDIYPKQVNDLFAGQTISLVGQYSAGANGRIYVNGRVGERPVRYEVQLVLPEREENHESLAFLWGRQKIHELSNKLLVAQDPKKEEIISRITNVALKYRLVSDYTAFVAVDEAQIVSGGNPLQVLQPNPIP